MATDTNDSKNLLARLNKEQVAAVCNGWGPLLVVAGAGSGKTTVLTRRIAYLISELEQDPYSVLAVTFTNKAAGEMKSRVEEILGTHTAKRLTIGTFHSICARLLRYEIENYETQEGWRWQSNFVIYDETDSLNVMKAQIKKLNLDDKVFSPKEMRHAISALKNDGYTSQLYSKEATAYREIRIAEIFDAYQSELARNNALDFDDLILTFTELVRQNLEVRERLRRRYRHVLVDEFQDTNKSQYEMVRLLTEPVCGEQCSEASEKLTSGASEASEKLTSGASEASGGFINDTFWQERSLMVVGDVDQSIYSWRKADYKIILGFENDFKGTTIIKLEENYRSTGTILEVANSIIENNTERLEKVLRCNKSKGARPQYYEGMDEIDEAYYVVEELKRLKARGRHHNDSVILYRTNAQSRSIEEVLVRSNIPYKVVGGTRFYDRQEIKDMIAYLKLVYNPKDGQAFNRVVNVPKRGIGKTSLDRLAGYAAERNISILEAAVSATSVPGIGKRAAQALKEFGYLVTSRWQLDSSANQDGAEGQSDPVSSLIKLILKDTKYLEMLHTQAEASKDELALGRIENIEEFIRVAVEFEEIADQPDLDSFLTRISLVSDLDQVELEDDAVKLMTLHSAKGLEFPVVFLIGLEDGLFPHIRTFDNPSELEEERRLMYVGVTRAGDLLYLTRARKRTPIGRRPGSSESNYTIPSRFLSEITAGLVTGFQPQPADHQDREPGYRVTTFEEDGYSSRGGSSNYGSVNYRDRQVKSFNADPRQSRKRPVRAHRQGEPLAANQVTAQSIREKFAKKNQQKEGSDQSPMFEQLSVGDTVQHSKFGLGRVDSILGEADKALYNVDFQDHGKRLLDPRVAKLIKLS